MPELSGRREDDGQADEGGVVPARSTVTPRTDPWAVGKGSRVDDRAMGSPGAGRSLRALMAWMLGAFGAVVLLAGQGFVWRATIVAALAGAWEIGLRKRATYGGCAWALVVAGLILMPLTTWQFSGRAPMLVAMVGVFVADAACVEWRPTKRWPQRTVTVTSLALPLLIAAQILWIRHERPLVTLVVLAAALALVEGYHRYPLRLRLVQGRVKDGLALVGRSIGLAIMFVVVTVVLYLPGILGRAVDAMVRRRAALSFWKQTPSSFSDVVRNADRPFATTSPAVRRRRHLLGLAAVGCVAVLTLILVQEDPPSRPAELEASANSEPSTNIFERNREIRFSDLPAFEGVAFADALKDEQDRFANEYLVPSEVGEYDVADFSGRFTNVAGGERRTIPPPSCDCPRYTVWLAGGSAAFGLGQRDERTIASELVRLGDRDNIALEVVNLGVPGWTLDQERQKVENKLDAGEPPALVLFYDGFNDVLGTMIGSTVNGIDPAPATRLDTDEIKVFTSEGLDPATVATSAEMGSLAATRYERVQRRTERYVERAGSATLFAFQPDAFTSQRQYQAVEFIYAADPASRAYVDGALEVASIDLGPDVVNFRRIFDRHPRPVFADLVHTNEEGAQVVAEHLYPVIKRQLGVPEGPS